MGFISGAGSYRFRLEGAIVTTLLAALPLRAAAGAEPEQHSPKREDHESHRRTVR